MDVTTERIQQGDRVLDAAVGIRLTIYSKQAEEDDAREAGAESPLRVYTYGQRLHFTAKLRMPRNYRNPGAMDMAGYLASQGIRLTGSARASSVEVLPGFVGSRIGLWRSAARRSVLARIMQLWPGERGALMQAMLIGGRAFFGREIKTDFQRTGTYHILVVSGINVGILAFAAFWTLAPPAHGRDLGDHHHHSAVVGLRVSGRSRIADCARDHHAQHLSSDPVALSRSRRAQRTRDCGARDSAGQPAHPVRSQLPAHISFRDRGGRYCCSSFAPHRLSATAGAQESRLAGFRFLAADACGAIPLRPAIDSRATRQTSLDRAWRTLWWFAAAGFVLGAAELLFISTVIQIALALPMAWYFHRATTMALPANALVIPIAEVLLPAAVVAVALSYVSTWLAYVPAMISLYALDALTGTIRIIGHMRISDVRVPTPTLAVCCAAAAAFGLALLLARRRMLWAAIGLAGLLTSAIWIVLFPPKPQWHPGVFEVTAIDVGQGDSLLLITPEGKTLLLDAGGVTENSKSEFDVGEEVVSPYLWSRGIRRLDAVAVSHAHTDHLGGMRSIIANFQPRELWYGVESPSFPFRELQETAKLFHVEQKALTAGDAFDYGGVHVRVLNPAIGNDAPRSAAGRRVAGSAHAIRRNLGSAGGRLAPANRKAARRRKPQTPTC